MPRFCVLFAVCDGFISELYVFRSPAGVSSASSIAASEETHISS